MLLYRSSENEQVSHCFPLNRNPNDPHVHGVDGILAVYSDILPDVVLQGPTNFREIIYEAASFAKQQEELTEFSYTILLIITDGVISDMNESIGEIVKASSLPLSIVIVGVGSADFSKMDILDGTGDPLIHNGVHCVRDIVQFLPFGDRKDEHYSTIGENSLREIPHQIVSYFRMKNRYPNETTSPNFNPSMQTIKIKNNNLLQPNSNHGHWTVDPNSGNSTFVSYQGNKLYGSKSPTPLQYTTPPYTPAPNPSYNPAPPNHNIQYNPAYLSNSGPVQYQSGLNSSGNHNFTNNYQPASYNHTPPSEYSSQNSLPPYLSNYGGSFQGSQTTNFPQQNQQNQYIPPYAVPSQPYTQPSYLSPQQGRTNNVPAYMNSSNTSTQPLPSYITGPPPYPDNVPSYISGAY